MKGKLALLVGGGVGYALGTRDGRQRYEQIKDKAESLWQDPKVQEKVAKAKHQAKQTTAEAASSAGSKLGSDKPAEETSGAAASTTGTSTKPTGNLDG